MVHVLTLHCNEFKSCNLRTKTQFNRPMGINPCTAGNYANITSCVSVPDFYRLYQYLSEFNKQHFTGHKNEVKESVVLPYTNLALYYFSRNGIFCV